MSTHWTGKKYTNNGRPHSNFLSIFPLDKFADTRYTGFFGPRGS